MMKKIELTSSSKRNLSERAQEVNGRNSSKLSGNKFGKSLLNFDHFGQSFNMKLDQGMS